MYINQKIQTVLQVWISSRSIWQGLENGNITFSDELDFDPSELDIVYQDNDDEEKHEA